MRWYPDLRIVAVVLGPSHPVKDSDLGAAPRVQWRDRAGIKPASHAQMRTHLVTQTQAGSPGSRNRSAVLKPVLSALVLAICLSGCAARDVRNGDRAMPVEHRRIISLIPSLTEDLIAVGARSQVVGVDQISADIPAAHGLPVVGNFSSIDSERIVQLHPDVVVAIPAQNRLLQPLRRADIAPVLFRDDSFNDIFTDLEGIGILSGHVDRARALERDLRARTKALHDANHFRHAPSVFVVLDTNPIYTVGKSSYIAALIRLAGGRNAADNLPIAYGSYSPEALLRLQPDAIVSDPSVGLQRVLHNEPWNSLRAVQQHHVYIVNPADILERPGPRYNEGLSWLIQQLKPLAR